MIYSTKKNILFYVLISSGLSTTAWSVNQGPDDLDGQSLASLRISDSASAVGGGGIPEIARGYEAIYQPFLSGKLIYKPEIARGYEAIYQQFLSGKLIYKPDPNSDAGRIELWIADLRNPLEGTFDLSRCGDASKRLSISTGYRKRINLENARKVEIWLTPRFVVEKDVTGTAPASHYRGIMKGWTAPIGIFWDWGGDDLKYYDYLITQSPKHISDKDLYYLYYECGTLVAEPSPGEGDHLSAFHVCFMN